MSAAAGRARSQHPIPYVLTPAARRALAVAASPRPAGRRLDAQVSQRTAWALTDKGSAAVGRAPVTHEPAPSLQPASPTGRPAQGRGRRGPAGSPVAPGRGSTTAGGAR